MGVYKVCVYSIYTVNEIEIDGVCLILCHCYLGEEKKKDVHTSLQACVFPVQKPSKAWHQLVSESSCGLSTSMEL